MCTDSKSLIDLVTKTSHTAEKCLLIYIACIRDALKLGYIDNITHILSEHNPVDILTKLKPGMLEKTIKKGRRDHPVQQWIIRRGIGSNKGENILIDTARKQRRLEIGNPTKT